MLDHETLIDRRHSVSGNPPEFRMKRRGLLLALPPLVALVAACSDAQEEDFKNRWSNWQIGKRVEIIDGIAVVKYGAYRNYVPKYSDPYSIRWLPDRLDSSQEEVAVRPFRVKSLTTGVIDWIAYWPEGQSDIICVPAPVSEYDSPVRIEPFSLQQPLTPAQYSREVKVVALGEKYFRTSLGATYIRYFPFGLIDGKAVPLGQSSRRSIPSTPTPIPTGTPFPFYTPVPTPTPTPGIQY